ncbi:MAG: ATP-binding protein [Lentisphaeria bacterium]
MTGYQWPAAILILVLLLLATLAGIGGRFFRRRSHGASLQPAPAVPSPENQLQEELRRHSRLLRLIRACSQWLARASSEPELLSQVCGVLTEAGDYFQAWVLVPDATAASGWRLAAGHRRDGMAVQPTGFSGSDLPPCDKLQHESLPKIVQELPANTEANSWQAAARAMGIRSCALFPISIHHKVNGLLGVEADRPGLFDAGEQAMLQELATDLAHSMQALRDHGALEAAERVLRQTVGSLRALINSSPLAIVSLDINGRVQSWNAAAETMFGWTAEEVVGRVLPIIPASDGNAIRRAWDDALANRTTAGTERQRLHKSGRCIDTILAVAPVRNDTGDATSILAIYADITEHKQLEAQFHQAQKLQEIGRLAGGVAHDFNNLLTVIQGHANLLRPAIAGQDPHGHVEQILKATASASALTSQLLAFSRRQVLRPRVLDLNDVIQDMEKMLRRLIGEAVSLSFRPDATLRPVKVDPSQMQQVLLNLAVNARDAMPKGGHLTIETANVELDATRAAAHAEIAPGHYVMLAVSDTGVGMAPEVRARLFEPFFTTKESGKGTGLGLAVVYGVVKQSNGHIWVYSEPGHGTTFKVFLPPAAGPVEVPRLAPTEAPAAPAPAVRAAQNETILLVEDDSSVRLLLLTMLEQAGFQVSAAETPAEAVKLAACHPGPIHLLLTDVILPGMDGRELARRLAPHHPGTRVLYVSGYTGNAAGQQGFLDNQPAFLQKPFSSSALLQMVRSVLDAPPGRFLLPVKPAASAPPAP